MYWSLLATHLAAYWVTVARQHIRLGRSEKGSLTAIEIVPLVIFNQLCITTAVIWSADIFGIELQTSGCTFSEGMLRFIGMILTLNFCFYTLHLLAHKWRWLYRNVHAVHHRLVVSVGYGAVYCHPIEHVFVNLGPVVAAIWMFGALNWWLIHWFVAVISWSTVEAHSCVKERGKGSQHYYHHYKNGCIYGNSPY